MTPHYVIERDANGPFRFLFVASTRATLFRSTPFVTAAAASGSIELLRERLRSADWALRQVGPDGAGYWFEILGGDGVSMGTSVAYTTRFARELAIEQMSLDGPSAPILPGEGLIIPVQAAGNGV